jgi:outer membrane protein assembly factor BamD (BamD/ComL family)
MQEKRDAEAITELQSFLHTFPDGPFTPRAKQVLKKLQDEQRATGSR